MKAATAVETADTTHKGLYVLGGAAALIAGLVFRRNLGPEVSLLSGQMPPDMTIGWFTLLQQNRLLGLALLNVFDIVDYALVGLMFIALYVVLKQSHESKALIALVLGLIGIAVYFASNTAFSLLSLSDQYAAATTDAQRSTLLAAGQTMLSMYNPGTVYQGTGIYLSFLLVAVAGLVISIAMLRSKFFGRTTAYVGILASVLDLGYCLAVIIAPGATLTVIGTLFVASAGLLLMIWHILIGLRLLQMGGIGLPSLKKRTVYG
ncbi:DUF4386 family protein [Methanocella sp. MCL-LM]|uniref:DUF4386 family protein n=1 Tax=Methanocella sp. MCL-LM TaxID=3412035 RepID=UPI003C73C3F9